MNMDQVVFRDVSDPMDTATPLFTGVKKLPVRATWGRESTITFRNATALPMTLTSITYDFQAGQQ